MNKRYDEAGTDSTPRSTWAVVRNTAHVPLFALAQNGKIKVKRSKFSRLGPKYKNILDPPLDVKRFFFSNETYIKVCLLSHDLTFLPLYLFRLILLFL